ncbi:MAG TPA: MerR family transcriptional regulator [Bradyrhizobium sp.]|uniref:MerR family transcriptional regulator n=1 Tax=Bradyrhizobium sp. TaxID=376 RepID=UPI002BA0B7D3|nr:MerR family transcriptional regulator [Bradyrhizobium sp.]HLZ03744.1 MerR family transcriptional regulator [Bradyrhizobium sp.]
MTPSIRFLSPSEAAKRLGVSPKALRLYEERGLISPGRTPAGWRAYGPEQMAEASEVVALRRLGLSLAQIARARKGEPESLEPALAAHQAALEARIRELAATLERVQGVRADLIRGMTPASGELARLLNPSATLGVSFELPWPWGGEVFELSDIRPLTYIIGPLGSGKTRLAQRLSETLPDAAFLGPDRLADGGAAARARRDADPALKARVDQVLSWLVDEGAVVSDALLALIVALESDGPAILVIDLVEQGLDQATQEALSAHLRQRARSGARPLFLLTRSTAILDLAAVGPDEAIILCPANHSPPRRVAPYPGVAGYEAVATCLASPEVRARTEGVIAWRPDVA